MAYTAYYVPFGGERVEYRRLRKTQAIWRYHWLTRNSRRLDLCAWGWGKTEGLYLPIQRKVA